MVQVRVAGVAVDAAGDHVILLKPLDALPGAGRVLPIWIGAQEATSILIAIEGAQAPRPLAHDLMRAIVTATDAAVERVEVTRIESGTFFAEVTLSLAAGTVALDARPSDAVALAARSGAPIFVADDVIDEAGIADITGEDEDPEENVEEFRRFLDDVDPDDFRG
ncbi:bifunctional nuclease family protein [Microbacterium sp. EYE_5]|uniref:bifunctional nuclease family protein n=1 Tax=unclassified Microbacterium TaxID=2609290 RepID=UPI0020034D27|nr:MULTISPECIES: bifunctional nuclease family protein [unclassified Microbacterium]MCK6080312.1 bifunctional nuclease family protein [Microbacterium sp. EYE_382]MCK6085583.1 bifunctional nuclease family protein [Microbacterium sp. EYE_384]MCK6122192.1 bifunctional nuclease family protein [Microbacterium sp. EYE_80]MCK6126346.1 bifunctional nuclease family protein [Microbacterium sp. EYE_79]MCK6141267.1 bifunctional nuclease family protein [Microbacterium sp. EYE_39]